MNEIVEVQQLGAAGRTIPKNPFNLKNRIPSADMHARDQSSYACHWLKDSITIHSDGNVTCGLDDPHSLRSYGNAFREKIADIFANPEFNVLQDKLKDGFRCRACNLYNVRDETLDHDGPQRRMLPSIMVIETTFKCNLRCPNAACDPNNDSAAVTRDKDELNLDRFIEIIDQLAGSLNEVYFFNYGEPFLHKQAEDMLLYLRKVCPQVKIVTSTNGILLSKMDRARKVAEAGVDYITFTLSGIRQGSYSRYHINGQVGQALQGLQNVCDARAELEPKRTTVIWRYLVFRWNDSEAEIDAAIALSQAYGVDQFSLYLTHFPANGASYRLAPGTPLHQKYRGYIDAVQGYVFPAADSSGMYDVEDVAGLGPARWSAWRCEFSRPRSGHWLRLALSTTRPPQGGSSYCCYVQTEWECYRVDVKPGDWNEIAILIPWAMKEAEMFNVGILVDDCWFPVEETGSPDRRCLGVLVRHDVEGAGNDDVACWKSFAGLSRVEGQERSRIAAVLAARVVPLRVDPRGKFTFA